MVVLEYRFDIGPAALFFLCGVKGQRSSKGAEGDGSADWDEHWDMSVFTFRDGGSR